VGGWIERKGSWSRGERLVQSKEKVVKRHLHIPVGKSKKTLAKRGETSLSCLNTYKKSVGKGGSNRSPVGPSEREKRGGEGEPGAGSDKLDDFNGQARATKSSR